MRVFEFGWEMLTHLPPPAAASIRFRRARSARPEGAKAQNLDEVDRMELMDIWLFGPLEHELPKSHR
jgi:hypothetical protein